jgi:hypothetical protein
MDKLVALSGILFFTADIFAIGSLANPDWIVTSEAGMHFDCDEHLQNISLFCLNSSVCKNPLLFNLYNVYKYDLNCTCMFVVDFESFQWMVAGNMRLGLTQHCQVIHGRPEVCTWPQLPAEWTLAFLCIIGGIVCLTTTCILLLLSHWHQRATRYVRWVALFASKSITFCTSGYTFTAICGDVICRCDCITLTEHI